MRPVSRRLGLAIATLIVPALIASCKSSEAPPVATTITISPSSATLAAIGRTQQFSAAVLDQHGGTMPNAVVTWASSDSTVVTVSATGLAAAVKNGTAQVTAKSGSATKSAAVTVSQVAAQVTKVSGDSQVGTPGQSLSVPLVVQVNDSAGNPMSGVGVAFSVTAGGGSVNPTSGTTAAGGQTQTTWTLGPSTGSQSASASVGGAAAAAAFTATAYASGTPAHVTAFLGDNQAGLVGYAVNVRPAVLVTDVANAPVTGATVTFAVTGGGGGAGGLVAATSSNGVAQVGSWTLGASPGVNTMTATVSGVAPFTFADTGVAAQYTIQLKYYGAYAPLAAESAAFNAAIAKWQAIIYRHPGPAVLVQDTAGTCHAGDPAVSQNVQDVLILASFDSIDGPGKVLAEASPCFARTLGPGAGLPLMGVMKFDTADVRTLIGNGTLNAVVEHEMGHVLGFGTLWTLSSPFPTVNCLQLPSTPPGTLQDTYFSCSGGTTNAKAQFDSVGGTSYTGAGQGVPSGHVVPVENCANSPYVYPMCGQGTVNSHWRQTVFGNELMVGFLPSNPQLSRVTAASLQDLGYTVNYAGSDPYTHTFTAAVAGGAPVVFLGDDIHHGPLFGVDPSGRIVLIKARQ